MRRRRIEVTRLAGEIRKKYAYMGYIRSYMHETFPLCKGIMRVG